MSKTISISAATAEALSTIGLGEFSGVNSPESMAFAALVLRELEDRPEWFPRGKWATIQHIETQLREYAAARAAEIMR